MLSEEDKKKIEEEEKEKLYELRYREKVKEKLNKTPWWKPKGKLTWLVLILIIISVIFINLQSNSGNKTSQQNASPSAETISQEDKDSLVQTLCAERSKANVRSVNFADFITMYEKNGEQITLNPANGKYPTSDNCKKIADICLELWKKEECDDIAGMKIWIGMSKDQLILSWGLPNDRNNSTYSSGIHTQWVYGGNQYVYLEGKSNEDLQVTSWQN